VFTGVKKSKRSKGIKTGISICVCQEEVLHNIPDLGYLVRLEKVYTL